MGNGNAVTGNQSLSQASSEELEQSKKKHLPKPAWLNTCAASASAGSWSWELENVVPGQAEDPGAAQRVLQGDHRIFQQGGHSSAAQELPVPPCLAFQQVWDSLSFPWGLEKGITVWERGNTDRSSK